MQSFRSLWSCSRGVRWGCGVKVEVDVHGNNGVGRDGDAVGAEAGVGEVDGSGFSVQTG